MLDKRKVLGEDAIGDCLQEHLKSGLESKKVFAWEDGDTSVSLNFYDQGPGKA